MRVLNFSASTLSGLSDEEVIARVLAGDLGNYEILMRRYNQRLYRIARSILRDESEAEDLVQDAYVRAYAALAKFRGEALFSTWLSRIAVHEANSRLRRKRRQQEFPANAGEGDRMESIRSSDPDPEQQTLSREAASFLEDAIDTLPDMYRCVFTMRDIEQMSTAEVADCLDLTEENVKIRLLRARQMLRSELYARAGASSALAFQFMKQRCDRIVRRVFEGLEASKSTINGHVSNTL
jgi:RNA polymerase sigma-70 factor (ECF subfamily)